MIRKSVQRFSLATNAKTRLRGDHALGLKTGRPMRDYTAKEKVRITVGAVVALVVVGSLVALAIASLSVR
jgi:hypothetical protein